MNDLKKVLLAGIGLTAMTVDKADSFVKELVEKGRLTVEEGKELEQELKRQSKEEAQEFLAKLDAKKSSVEYATKDDVKRLEEGVFHDKKGDQLTRKPSTHVSIVYLPF